MSSYVITVNERMRLGKTFLSYLKTLSMTSDYVNIIAHRDSKMVDETVHDNVIGMYIEKYYYRTGRYGNNNIS